MSTLTATQQQVIADLLMLADGLDLAVDQPYMPEPNTSFTEAVAYLKANGKILVQGGTVFYMENYGTYVGITGRKELPVLPWDSIQDILAANYPGRPIDKEEWEQVENDELIINPTPTEQPAPVHCIPMEGLGLYAPEVEYGVDLDILNPDVWEVCKFIPEVAEGSIYVCETSIDGQPHTVWFHLLLGKYLAQSIPSDLLSE